MIRVSSRALAVLLVLRTADLQRAIAPRMGRLGALPLVTALLLAGSVLGSQRTEYDRVSPVYDCFTAPREPLEPDGTSGCLTATSLVVHQQPEVCAGEAGRQAQDSQQGGQGQARSRQQVRCRLLKHTSASQLAWIRLCLLVIQEHKHSPELSRSAREMLAKIRLCLSWSYMRMHSADFQAELQTSRRACNLRHLPAS